MLVRVQVHALYRKTDEMYVSKIVAFVLFQSFLFLKSLSTVFSASIASPFLLFISHVVSSNDPSSLHFFHDLSDCVLDILHVFVFSTTTK